LWKKEPFVWGFEGGKLTANVFPQISLQVFPPS